MTEVTPAIRALDAPAATLGEGPTFEPATGTAWWFDILGQRLYEHDLAFDSTRVHALPFMASALARVDDRRQLLVAEDGLYLRERSSGQLTLYRPLEADSPQTRSNDSRVHPCGAFWIGTMGRNAEEAAGAIYWLFKGELRTLYSGITIPNAICFAPDGRTAYFTDTPTGAIRRVPLDPATALPTGEPARFDDASGEGSPDGAVVDAEGVLWIARWGGRCLEAYSPNGQRVRAVPLPVSQPTCPAFVGEAGSSLLVTSAREGLSEAQIEDERVAGATFVLDLRLKGRFEPDVCLAG